MGTILTIEVVSADDKGAIDRAFGWFAEVERRCSRFDPQSELRQLKPGLPVRVSDLLFSAVSFALAVAHETNGAFDPTVGGTMEIRGFSRNYRTGESTAANPAVEGTRPTYRDVSVDSIQRTILLQRPLVLDLGAVAKGLAIDLAARELREFRDFAIDAGGDLYLAGSNPDGCPWIAGIRHPRRDKEVIEKLRMTNAAICTSGDYERPEHILDPGTGDPASHVASATAIAPTAMLADALATAAFVLGPEDGIAHLQHHGVEGVLFTPDLVRYATPGYEALLSHA